MCLENATGGHEPYHCGPRYPHPIKVKLRAIPDALEALVDCLKHKYDDAEMRPSPMVNVTEIPPSGKDNDNHNLSSYIEVSQCAIPSPALEDGFIPIVHRSSQLRSSDQLIRLIPLIRLIQSRHMLKVEAKFEKFTTIEDFNWWHHKIWNGLMHVAWGRILDQCEPYANWAALGLMILGVMKEQSEPGFIKTLLRGRLLLCITLVFCLLGYHVCNCPHSRASYI